nr:PREDICTED: steroid receptor RNA activator 1 isoform X3 [Paralichthys olivaceus]
MEDMYVKAGNQERGWNDPPQFSYGLQMARGPPRNLLNKRAAPPVSGSGAPPPMYPSANPLAPPRCGIAPPTLHTAHPPPDCVASPLPPAGPMRSQKEAGSSPSESVPDVEVVVLVLRRALAACRHTVRDQVCNDVEKRLLLLEDGWRSGRLSLPVRRRMDALSQGVQEPVEPVQQPAGPVQEPVEPVQQPVGPVQQPAGPVQEPVGPVQQPAGPVQEPAGPVQEPAGPVQQPVSHS